MTSTLREGPRRPLWLQWLAISVAAAYAFTLTSAVFAQDPARLSVSLGLGSFGAWPTVPFVVRMVAVTALLLALTALAGAPRAPLEGPFAQTLLSTPARRMATVAAPWFATVFSLLQDDLVRRAPIVAALLGASVALAAWLLEVPASEGVEPQEGARGRWLREHGPMLAVIALHAVIFARITIVRDRALWSATVDLGIFKEALWSALHGRGLHSPTVGYSFLGEHFAPVLFLLAPLYALSPTSDCLLTVQALAVAVSAWPLYLLGRDLGLGRSLSTALATAMIFAPPVQGALLYDFHMDLLAVPAMAWLALASHRARWGQAAVATALMVSTKEDMFVAASAVLVAAALSHKGRDRRIALAIALAATAYCVVAMKFLLPRFGPPPGVPVYMADEGEPPGGYKFLRNYKHFVGPMSPLRMVVAMPLRWLLYALSEARLTTLMVLVLPVGLLPFSARTRALLMAPAAIVLLSDNPEVVALRYHYGAIQHPGMYAAAMYGAARWIERSSRPERMRAALTAMVCVAAMVMAWMHPNSVASPVHSTDARAITAHVGVVQRMVNEVPGGVRVTSTSFGGPRFSNRRWVGIFPTGVARSDWVLVDMQRPAWPAQPPQRDEFVLAMLRSAWSVVDWEDGAVLFRRTGGDRTHNDVAARDLLLRRRYEVEGTEWTDFTGSAERDASASDGWARVVRPTDPRGAGWMVFGPFVKLPPGRYVVRFRLRAEPSGIPGDVGAVDVHATPEVVLASRRLWARDFADAGWREIALPFTVEAQENLEFRVYTSHRWLLAADTISLAVDGDEEAALRDLLHPH